jgi:dual specificity tyrosine-phosphorylation-regulated kinase 2/3/4
MDHDIPISRSTSTTSSLDPYYFGIRSPSDSPVPPLPTCLIYPSSTSGQHPAQDPVTPARDPASIDRRGLVGVGELTTPRWARTEHHDDLEIPDNTEEIRGFEVLMPEVAPDDQPDSPWTIEAVDSESSEKEEVGSIPSSLKHTNSLSSSAAGCQASIPFPSHSAFNRGRKWGRRNLVSPQSKCTNA